jgi:hypothetical protein
VFPKDLEIVAVIEGVHPVRQRTGYQLSDSGVILRHFLSPLLLESGFFLKKRFLRDGNDLSECVIETFPFCVARYVRRWCWLHLVLSYRDSSYPVHEF